MATDLEMPDWLNKEFVEGLLRENENDATIVVDALDVRSAVAKGENYGSTLHRVGVELTKGGVPAERHLLVKSLPPSEFFAKFMIESSIFEKETRMYLDTLDKMYRLPATEPLPSLSCKCYRTSRPHTIVMEDLARRGYKNACRFSGLDLAHSALGLRAMARLHAMSLALLVVDPACMDTYAETMYVEDKIEMARHFLEPAVAQLASQVERWEGYERFGDKLRQTKFAERTVDEVKIGDSVAVLNHGDGWSNNMMFRYSEEDGSVQDMKFVDFQMSRYVSPGLDIQYFMHTSPAEEVRLNHWDELMAVYHETFAQTVRALGLDPDASYTLEGLKKEVEKKTFFGLLTSCTVLPIVIADPDDAPDLGQMGDLSKEDLDVGELKKVYDGTRFRNVLQKLLLHFESIKLL